MAARIISGGSATEEDERLVREALARASRELDEVRPLLQRLVRRLFSEHSRRSRARPDRRSSQRSTTSSNARPQSAGSFRSRRNIDFRQLAQGFGPSDTQQQFERDINRPAYRALALCFAVDFFDRLGEAISVVQTVNNKYGLARSMLENSTTTLRLRRGGRPPAGIPAGAYAWAPMREAARFGDDSVLVFDPFFGEPGQVRRSILTRAGRGQDFELARAAILIHELLHWRLGPGHHRNGFLRNPQNYEFFMILRYSSGLMSPSLNWPFVDPDYEPGETPGLDQWRRW